MVVPKAGAVSGDILIKGLSFYMTVGHFEKCGRNWRLSTLLTLKGKFPMAETWQKTGKNQNSMKRISLERPN
jgi:hypothetical protein